MQDKTERWVVQTQVVLLAGWVSFHLIQCQSTYRQDIVLLHLFEVWLKVSGIGTARRGHASEYLGQVYIDRAG